MRPNLEHDFRSIMAGSWAEPRRAASGLVALLSRPDAPPAQALADTLERQRPDQPVALWLAEALRRLDPRQVAHELSDSSWIDETAESVHIGESIGLVSLGSNTLRLLDRIAGRVDEEPEVIANRSSIVQGLKARGHAVRRGKPWRADVGLVPAAASTSNRVWTSEDGARLLARSPQPILTVDPLTVLTPAILDRFRPPDWLVDVDAPHDKP